MMEQQIQTIKQGKIEKPIFNYTVVSHVDVNRMAASDGPLPLVKLAKIGSKLYPIGGFAALKASKMRGENSLQCLITNYKTKQEAVKAGLREYSVSEPINILKLRDICDFLKEDAGTISTQCNMGGMHFEKIVAAFIIPEVYDKLEAVIAKLSTKLPASMLAIPPHIVIGLAKADPKKQMAVFDTIYADIEFEKSELQFTWPTPGQISIAVRETGIVEEEDAVVVHVQEEETIQRTKPTEYAKEEEEQDHRQESDETLQLMKQLKNSIIIPEKDGTHLVVDTKTKNVQKVALTDNKLNFTTLDAAAERALIMPPTVVKHLDLASAEAHEKRCNSAAEAISYLKTVRKTAHKIAIFWTE